MPIERSRRVTIALYLAFAALSIPVVLTVAELGSGGGRGWLRLTALAIAIGALGAVHIRLRELQGQLREQERVDEALRASEAKFSGILAIAADAIITVDKDERIVHFNQGAAAIFGYSIEDARGQQLDILLPKRVRGVHHSQMQGFAESPVQARRMGERREISGLRRDGSEFPAEASISKIDGPEGPLFTVVLRDITERRRAEQDEQFLSRAATEVARSLEYTAVLQTITDLAVLRLADGAVLDVIEPDGSLRRVASAEAGSGRAQLLGEIAKAGIGWESPSPVIDVIRRGVTELFTDIDDDWVEAHEEFPLAPAWRTVGMHSLLIVPLTAGGQALGTLSLLLVDPRRSFNADLRNLAEKFAQPVALSVVNASLYAAAQQANQARDEVMTVVSHDLRNPLSAIAMCVQALRASPPPEPDVRDDMLATIGESVDAMNRLIQDLVDVASIERGQLSLERVKGSPARLIERAAHMFAVETAGHGIMLAQEAALDLPELGADEARIVQVLANLIRNAIKFTPDGGRITIGAAAVDGAVQFTVTDTGIGIDPALHRRIFDRYWHASTGARKQGTGLGLSIAKGIVEAHGGRLSVESAVGAGSRFTFTIPLSPPRL
jgi:PAS domain S-box-containing protein